MKINGFPQNLIGPAVKAAIAAILLLGQLGPRPAAAAAPAAEGVFPRRGSKNAAGYVPLEAAPSRPAPSPAEPRLAEPRLAEPSMAEPSPAAAADDTTVNIAYSMLTAPDYKQFDIWFATNLAGPETNLTKSSANDYDPRVNPGATKIAFASDQGDPANKTTNIYTIHVDGSGLTRLTNVAAKEYSPAWSPDGTQIVFQSLRDGNYNIYVMNADGSSPTRLTDNPDYDGEPYWARDGSQIVFSSYRNGGYRIWSMNPDGSEQTQLSQQPYSENPVVSPDGKQVVYNCDSDGDTFMEAWLMNSDGTNQHLYLDKSGGSYYIDVLAGSWSPDQINIAVNTVQWQYYNSAWYWTYANLDIEYVPITYYNRWSTIAKNTAFHPDWQPMDNIPPTLNITPLPAASPSPIVVTWTVAPPDSVWLAEFQVKEGVNGAWSSVDAHGWYSISGTGGQTFFFRLRVWDELFNFTQWTEWNTTIESLPPVTTVTPLAEYTAPNKGWLEWSAVDPGGSGVASYDVQYRNLSVDGDWTDLQTGIVWPSCSIDGLPKGYEIAFRVRARDKAQNVEDWPASKLGSARSTPYALRLTGTVFDQTGLPVRGVLPVTDLGQFTQFLSDPLGAFTALTAQTAASIGFTFFKSGYGVLPTTTNTFVTDPQRVYDTQRSAKLPPGDNLVSNPGLEFLGAAQAPWLTSGVRLPIPSSLHYTGVSSIQLGSPTAYGPPETLAQSYILPAALVDSQGRLHTLLAADGKIYYQARESSGTWSNPIPVSVLSNSAAPQLIQTPDGVLHAFWDTYANPYSYFQLWTSHYTPGDTAWYPAEFLGYGGFNNGISIAQDASGGLHAAWISSLAGSAGVWYAARPAGGSWSAPANLDKTSSPGYNIWTAVDANGGIHILYDSDSDHSLYHLVHPSGGAWAAAPLTIPPADNATFSTAIFSLVSDSAGGLFMAWGDYSSSTYVCKIGHWTAASGWTVLKSLPDTYRLNLKAGADGTMHLITNPMNNYPSQYMTSTDGITWSAPSTLPGSAITFLVRPDGVEVAIANLASKQMTVTEWDGSAWTDLLPVGNLTYTFTFTALMLAGPDGAAHLFYSDSSDYGTNQGSLYYAYGEPVPAAGASSLAQQVSLPAGTAHPILSYMYRYQNLFPGAAAPFSVTVQAEAGDTTRVSTTVNHSDWTLAWFDLTPWAGQTVTLAFQVALNAGYRPAAAWVDDVTVGAGQPDLWVEVSSPPAPIYPGEEETVTITYGNRGPAPAEAFTLTAEIPAGLEVVSSTPAGTLVGQTLTWSSASLAALSGTQSLQVVLRAGPGTELQREVVMLGAANAAAELEQGNNTAQFTTIVKGKIFLPMCTR